MRNKTKTRVLFTVNVNILTIWIFNKESHLFTESRKITYTKYAYTTHTELKMMSMLFCGNFAISLGKVGRYKGRHVHARTSADCRSGPGARLLILVGSQRTHANKIFARLLLHTARCIHVKQIHDDGEDGIAAPTGKKCTTRGLVLEAAPRPYVPSACD